MESANQIEGPLSLKEAERMLTSAGAPFELGELDIVGQRLRVWKHTPKSLRDIFEASPQFGDLPFIVYEDERLSFAEHHRQTVALAHALVNDWNVKKGERVAIAMRNFPEWSVAFWASQALGAVSVPLNAWMTGEELEYGLADSGTRVLICDQERADTLAPHFLALELDAVIVVRASEDLIPGHQTYEDVVGGHGGHDQLPNATIGPDEDATIFYTSGTTGRPKGALGTQRNICTNLVALAYLKARGTLRAGLPFPPQEDEARVVQLLSAPFFHATGCHSTLIPALAFGSTLVLMYKWNPERALELIEREKVTRFGGVPGMVWQVLESPDFDNRDLSSVASVGYGGAPAAPELVRRINEAFPESQSSNGYGLTETSSVTTLNAGPDYVDKPDSVGPAVPVCDVKIMSPEDEQVAVGQLGEIWIRGPNVVKGYWNRPDATAEAITDGWLRSGDLGYVDEDGFFYVVDRAKDMLVRGGENVYSVEIEDILYSHPDIMDAAIIGIPHRILGEEVGAVVQIRPGAEITQQHLQLHVGAHLAAFKVPTKIDIRIEPLPRNANGKILKRALKEELGWV